MAVLNYSRVVNDKTSFTSGQDTKILISPAYARGSAVPFVTVYLAGNATPQGTGATIEVDVANGVIIDLIITAGGSGYTDGAVVAFSGSGSGASATLIVVGGVVTGYTDLVGGIGYGATGTTATVTGFTNATGAITVGTQELILDAPLPDLYEGTRLPFLDNGVLKPVYVSQFTPAGSQSVSILPSKYDIAVSATAKLNAYIPLLSVNQVNLDQKADVIKELNFSAGLFYQKAVTGIDGTSSAQGTQIYGDPGLNVLERANLNAQLVYVTVLKGSQRGGAQFEAIVAGLPESVQRNGFFQQTINFEPSGAVDKFDY